MARLAALWLLICVGGCYTYQPLDIADLTPGDQVRARVTGAFSDSLLVIIGSDDRELEGAFVERQADEIFVDVPVSSEFRGMRLSTLNQRLAIPGDAVVELSRKDLSRGRTALAMGGVLGVGSAIVIAQLAGQAGGGALPGGGGPVEAVIAVPLSGLVRALGGGR